MDDDLKQMLAGRLGVTPEQLPLLLDVEVAGKAVGDLNRSKSYRAAADGSLPTVLIGRRKKVLTSALLKKLASEVV